MSIDDARLVHALRLQPARKLSAVCKLNDEEHATLLSDAEAAGMSVSSYMRECLRIAGLVRAQQLLSDDDEKMGETIDALWEAAEEMWKSERNR